MAMNKDTKPGEIALVELRSDIRALIEGLESEHLLALNAVTALFIAACAGWDKVDSQSGAVDDRNVIDELIDKAVLELKLSDSVSQAVRNVTIGLNWMHKRNHLSDQVSNNLILHVLLASAMTGEILCRIFAGLHVLDLSTSGGRQRAASVFDDAVRFMVARNEKFLGEFITPEPVADLMLELADLSPGEKVYDPCFGFGELLVGASRRLKAAPRTSSQRRSVGPPSVSGVETQGFAHLVTLCRLLLAGIDSPGLECGDALRKPLPENGSETGFDCILAAPPWGEGSGGLPYEQFPVPSAHAEDLFLQHVMAYVRPGGRVVVALPERTLFHTESSAMRKALLLEYRVDGVVALPAGAFEPCTSISTSVVVFSRREPRDSVRFVIVSPMAWEAVQEDASGNGDGQSLGELPSSRLSRGKLLRDVSISEMVRNHLELPADAVSPGVESWAVPVHELALRDYELIAKKSGGEMLDAEIERLVATDRSLKVRPLGEVAEISEGQWHGPQDITEEEDASVSNSEPEEVPVSNLGALFRSVDVTDVGMRAPSVFLRGDFMEHFGEGQAILRDGDLLVPIADTIGTIGLVADIEGWAGVMADDSIALVRARAAIKPQFLAALLRSPAYWFWLSGHAMGSTIRRLSIPVLRTLKIPVPSLSVQDAVLKELSEPRADALAVLYRLLARIAGHPVALWLETPLPAKLVTGGSGDDRAPLSTLSEIAQGIRSLNASAEAATYDPSCSAWLAIARKAFIALDGVDSIPPGSGRLAILEIALARFHESIRALEGAEGSTIERLRSFTGTMVELAERAVHDMQHVINLDVGAGSDGGDGGGSERGLPSGKERFCRSAARCAGLGATTGRSGSDSRNRLPARTGNA